MGKPVMFKIAGAWVWRCDHGGRVGDEFHSGRWRDPWTACLAAAIRHTTQFHDATETADELDVP